MTQYWKLALMAHVAGFIVWVLTMALHLEAAATLLLPVALYLGTVVPATYIAIDIARRYFSHTLSTWIQRVLLATLAVVALALIALHSFSLSHALILYATVSVAIWGMMGLGLLLTMINGILWLGMARNTMRVASGRRCGVGMLLIGIGSVALTLPLLFLDMTEQWPLLALPGMIVCLVGLRQQD